MTDTAVNLEELTALINELARLKGVSKLEIVKELEEKAPIFKSEEIKAFSKKHDLTFKEAYDIFIKAFLSISI